MPFMRGGGRGGGGRGGGMPGVLPHRGMPPWAPTAAGALLTQTEQAFRVVAETTRLNAPNSPQTPAGLTGGASVTSTHPRAPSRVVAEMMRANEPVLCGACGFQSHATEACPFRPSMGNPAIACALCGRSWHTATDVGHYFEPTAQQQQPQQSPQQHRTPFQQQQPQQTPVASFTPASRTPSRSPQIARSPQQQQQRFPQQKQKRQRKWFAEHISREEATRRVQEGTVVLGGLRVSPKIKDAYVTVEGFAQDVYIDGVENRNRGFDGDVVVIELLPMDKWKRLSGPHTAVPETLEDEDAVGGHDDDLNVDEEEVEEEDESSDEEEEVITKAEIKKEDPVATFTTPTPLESAPVTSETPLTTTAITPIIIETPTIAATTTTTTTERPKLHIMRRPSEKTPAAAAAATTPQPQTTVRSVEEEAKQKLLIAEARNKNKKDGDALLQPVGHVLAIWEEKHTSLHAGYITPRFPEDDLDKTPDSMCVFKPIDKRVPWGLLMPRSNGPLRAAIATHGSEISKFIWTANFLPWRTTDWRPTAQIQANLGKTGNIDVETTAILQEYGVQDVDFSSEVNSCLPSIPWSIPAEELSIRRDLREKRIFTVDPTTARDLDDAVSCWPVGNGQYDIGVHIADVSHFVTPDTALDLEAQTRSTSVYLVQKVIPMLPRVLCENLCSLNPGVDRFAFSVIWRMDENGDIVPDSEWFGKTVIRSCCKLNYGLAQCAIEGKVKTAGEQADKGNWEGAPAELAVPAATVLAPHTVKEVVDDIVLLNRIARKMRAARELAGGMSVGNAKLYIALDKEGQPIDAVPYVIREANEMIEDWMLLANKRVAIHLAKHMPDRALLRNHRPPLERRLDEFVDFCERENLGVVKTTTPKEYSDSLKLLKLNTAVSPYIADIITFFAIKPMQLAKYFCTGSLPQSEWRHYALAFDFYTHFTSPIRRYPDLMVHRQLQSTLVPTGITKLPNCEELSKICNNSNDKKVCARKVQDASSKMFLCVLVRDKQVYAEGVVLGITEEYISVYVPKYVFEKRVYLKDMPHLLSVLFEEEQKQISLKWPSDPSMVTADSSASSTAAVPTSDKLTGIRKQLEFYFSKANLKHDRYMVEQMSKRPDRGVLVSELMRFQRLKAATDNNSALVIQAAKMSDCVSLSTDGMAVVVKKSKDEEEKEKRAAKVVVDEKKFTEVDPAHPSIIQTIKLFSTLLVRIGVEPNKMPMEPCVVLLHPTVMADQQQKQQQQASKPTPAATCSLSTELAEEVND